MNKNVYSIVLTDDVIRAVDRQAYLLGTNRSNLINQILAEHLSCVTPEMKMQRIFDEISRLVDSGFVRQQSNAMLTLRTALEYKYRPTISYRLELERIPGEYLGRIKVSIRTQSPQLIELFGEAFRNIACIEAEVLSEHGCGGYRCELNGANFIRYVLAPERLPESEQGELIGSYLELLSAAVKTYFACPGNMGAVFGKYRQDLEELINQNDII